MIRKIIYAIGMFLFIGLWINGAGELSIAGEVGDESVKARSSFNQNAADRRQLPVLSISPREIDLGTIKQDEVSFGEFVLRNVAPGPSEAVSYTHLRAHETVLDLVCRLLLEKKKKK